jgi:phthiocerol/phenolphthiocerol synthesis type-I polyketide synthase D
VEEVAAAPVQDAEAIQAWLIGKLAEALQISPDEIDESEPFARYGIGSAQAVSMAGDLEDWLGRALPATLLYDHPTIDALAHYLSASPEVSEGRVPADDVSLADDT